MSDIDGTAGENTRRGTRRAALTMVGVVVAMGALSFAAVPLYDMFCRVTGFGGTTQRAESGADTVLDRTVTVRFDASVNRNMPWRFRPLQTEMRVRIGETAVAYYEAHNPTDAKLTGSATFNVAPFQVGAYFNKIECFCFTEQTLAPGEKITMPVQFFVDPDMVEDPEYGDVSTITLSYTFFRHEQSADAAKGDVTDGVQRR